MSDDAMQDRTHPATPFAAEAPPWAAPPPAPPAWAPPGPPPPAAPPWAAPAFGAPPPGAGYAPGPPAPETWGPAPGAPSAAAWPTARTAELQRARARADKLLRDGALWIAAGVAITLGTLLLAPGGFFIVSFGPVIQGVTMISRGQKLSRKLRSIGA